MFWVSEFLGNLRYMLFIIGQDTNMENLTSILLAVV